MKTLDCGASKDQSLKQLLVARTEGNSFGESGWHFWSSLLHPYWYNYSGTNHIQPKVILLGHRQIIPPKHGCSASTSIAKQIEVLKLKHLKHKPVRIQLSLHTLICLSFFMSNDLRPLKLVAVTVKDTQHRDQTYHISLANKGNMLRNM